MCRALDDGEVREGGIVEEVLFCCGWYLEVSIEGGDVGLGGNESSFSEMLMR